MDPMRQVLGNLMGANRRTIRAPINTLDKATVVSIFPREIDEYKCTIQPGRFIIPPGTYDSPAVLVVGPSSWWRDVDIDQPLLEIPQSSITVADSIVRDYYNGILGCNMGDAIPGLFYVPGAKTPSDIKKEFKAELEKANEKQRNWYTALVKLADSLWARSNGNPIVVSEDMKLAARELGVLSIKDWMKTQQMIDMTRCKACGSLINPTFPVCPTCKAITDPAKAKELGLSFAS